LEDSLREFFRSCIQAMETCYRRPANQALQLAATFGEWNKRGYVPVESSQKKESSSGLLSRLLKKVQKLWNTS
jgi:hypothetical protein